MNLIFISFGLQLFFWGRNYLLFLGVGLMCCGNLHNCLHYFDYSMNFLSDFLYKSIVHDNMQKTNKNLICHKKLDHHNHLFLQISSFHSIFHSILMKIRNNYLTYFANLICLKQQFQCNNIQIYYCYHLQQWKQDYFYSLF